MSIFFIVRVRTYWSLVPRLHSCRRIIECLVVLLGVMGISRVSQATDDFEAEVVPLLISRCLECHNSDQRAGGLVLNSEEGFLRGGDSGEAFDAGSPLESLVWQRVRDGEMPPPRQGMPQVLPDSEKEQLSKWLKSGAAWPKSRTLDLFERTTKTRGGRDWWSLQPIAHNNPPEFSAKGRASNYIDAFILSELEKKQWQLAPTASREILLRRLYWDVLGLAPSMEDIADFVADTHPDAYERQVEKLLSSPQFGVRWGRYWLDLVRYADTSGYERDQEKTFAWKYRDWVVRAINEDLPYDQFVRWQLAGDEAARASKSVPQDDALIATGFLRLGTWNDEPNDPKDYVYERLEDLVNVTSNAFLGLTVKCARCHDHKFDPISQVDYYRLGSVFWAGPVANRNSKWLGGPSSEELPGDYLAWTDLSRQPTPLRRLRKGETNQPLEVVEPATLSFVPALQRDLSPPSPESRTSQRRTQLADWLLDKDHPLTARVIVNRLWQFHFGEGLVRSPSNWGFTGELPTHPQLLDYLASRLIDSGWSLKRLHREILLSETYRQASNHPQSQQYEQTDAGNRLWWRSNLRRMDAESLRDHLLQATGELDLRLGGPGFRPPLPKDVLDGLSMKSRAWTVSDDAEQVRRSLYLYSQRSLAVPLMNTFDACDSTQPCAKRDTTTVAPQALALLNNSLVVKPCEALAKQVRQRHEDVIQQVITIWKRMLRREPQVDELQRAIDFVLQQEIRFTESIKIGQESSTTAADVSSSIREVPVLAEFDASRNIDYQAGSKLVWREIGTGKLEASVLDVSQMPSWVAPDETAPAHLRFNGNGQFLVLNQTVLEKPELTFLAVVRDRGGEGHREIFSNWNGAAGNSVTSFFVGLTGAGRIRVSDDFTTQNLLGVKDRWHALAVVCSEENVEVYVDGRLLEQKGAGLTPRDLSGTYVIGQQGNIQGEYWNGDIAWIKVYAEPLLASQVEAELLPWYQKLGIVGEESVPDVRILSLASLAQVLAGANEFLYVD
jgi:hypothetical protein